VTVADRVVAPPSATVDGFAEAVTVELATVIVTEAGVVVVEAAKFVSPGYVADSVCEPAVSVAVYVALPPDNDAVPSTVVPSLKVISPVAAPGATVTVITVCVPYAAVAGVAAIEVVVAASDTVTVTTVEVDPAKFVSPEYTAVIECVPAVSVDVEKLAVPPETAPAPKTVVPSLNVTVPVAAELDNVAINCVDVPYAKLLGVAVRPVVVVCWFTVTVAAAEVDVA
jgi:hypothetical protein